MLEPPNSGCLIRGKKHLDDNPGRLASRPDHPFGIEDPFIPHRRDRFKNQALSGSVASRNRDDRLGVEAVEFDLTQPLEVREAQSDDPHTHSIAWREPTNADR